VTDRVKLNKVSIEYCPTGEMDVDFFTKPLQGSLFQKFRDRIMYVKTVMWADTEDTGSDHRSVLRKEECTKTKERLYMVSELDGFKPQNTSNLKR
jgi:hypothetical protein